MEGGATIPKALELNDEISDWVSDRLDEIAELAPDEDAEPCRVAKHTASMMATKETNVPLYLTRWPDGSCSVVKAHDRAEAIVLLDEFGNADTAELFPLKHFMMDFTLDPSGYGLVVNEMGEETHAEIFKKAYPILQAAQSHNEADPAYPAMLAQAIAEEEGRVKPRMAPLGETKDAMDLQRDFDMPATLADRIVRQVDQSLKRQRPKRDAN